MKNLVRFRQRPTAGPMVLVGRRDTRHFDRITTRRRAQRPEGREISRSRIHNTQQRGFPRMGSMFGTHANMLRSGVRRRTVAESPLLGASHIQPSQSFGCFMNALTSFLVTCLVFQSPSVGSLIPSSL